MQTHNELVDELPGRIGFALYQTLRQATYDFLLGFRCNYVYLFYHFQATTSWL